MDMKGQEISLLPFLIAMYTIIDLICYYVYNNKCNNNREMDENEKSRI